MPAQKFGIIGQNIGYSLSPAIHLFSAKSLSLDISYEIFEPAADNLESFITNFFATDGAGLSVTTPFKILAAQLLPNCNQQAINTIYSESNHLVGASTDATGFFHGLASIGYSAGDFSRICVLGNGGAAYTLIAHCLQLSNPPEIYVFRRNMAHDKELLTAFPTLSNCIFDLSVPALARALGNLATSKTSLVIQATKAPQSGDTMAALLPAFAHFAGVFVDLNYAQPSDILRFLRDRGNACQNGLPMLIEQARQSQYLWWGKAPAYELIEQFLRGTARHF